MREVIENEYENNGQLYIHHNILNWNYLLEYVKWIHELTGSLIRLLKGLNQYYRFDHFDTTLTKLKSLCVNAYVLLITIILIINLEVKKLTLMKNISKK